MQIEEMVAWLGKIWDEDEKAEGRKFRSRKGVPQPDSTMHDWPEGGLVTIRRHGGDSETVMSHADYLVEFCKPNPDQLMLARIAAERALLAYLTETESLTAGPEEVWLDRDAYEQAIKIIASGYAARPGYDERWRP